MVIAAGKWLGEDWESHCLSLAGRHYGIENLQEVPSRHGGDLGIEAFTHTGVAIQCYASESYTSVSDRYASQRDKLTEDLAKLERYADDLVKLLGDTKIRSYLFMVPVLDSRKIVQHATAKSREYRAKALPHLHRDFRVTVVTDAIFSDSRAEVLQQKAILRDLYRSGRILYGALEDLDPIIDLGVHRCIESKDSPLPPYVPRDVDKALDEAVLRGGLVVIEGNSAAGKTRTALQAVLRNQAKLGWRSILIARDGAALRSLAESDFDFRNTIIWLDDLERYLASDGLDEVLFRRICPTGRTDVLLIATLRAKAKEAVIQGEEQLGASVPARGYSRMLAAAHTVSLNRHLNSSERQYAQSQISDSRIQAALTSIDGCGLAEYLAAGPAAVTRWVNGKNGANELGAALISAAVDIRLAGFPFPIPRLWLERICRSYVEPRVFSRVTPADFNSAFAWAEREIQGASSCLIPGDFDTYSAFDYLVDYRQGSAGYELSDDDAENLNEIASFRLIPGDVWHDLFDHISLVNPAFLSCASMATLAGHPGLMREFQKRITAGQIDESDLDVAHIVNLVRSCEAINFCVVCVIGSVGLNIISIIEKLLASLDAGKIEVDSSNLTTTQSDVLFALNSIALNGRPDRATNMTGRVIGKISADRLFSLGTIMMQVGANESGYIWVACAARQRHEAAIAMLRNMSKPLELIKDERRKKRVISVPGSRSRSRTKRK